MLGKGTTFTIYLPVTRRIRSKLERPLTLEECSGNGERVLVVDDVAEQREVASTVIAKLGYSVETVSSGEAAIEYLKKLTVDLIVLDMIMDPGIDGLETYERILEIHPFQKAIIASGYSETNRVQEAQRLGAGKYVKKPYTIEKLGVAVKEAIEANNNVKTLKIA